MTILEKDYPKTAMSGEDCYCFYWEALDGNKSVDQGMYRLANEVLRRACESGQVVPREEVDSALADRWARDMAIAHAVNNAVKDAGYPLSDKNVHKIIESIKP